jgi:hypothetical protein
MFKLEGKDVMAAWTGAPIAEAALTALTAFSFSSKRSPRIFSLFFVQ